MIFKLIQAVTDYIEARAELHREELATLNLGTFARGYEMGREDTIKSMGLEILYVGDDEEDED